MTDLFTDIAKRIDPHAFKVTSNPRRTSRRRSRARGEAAIIVEMVRFHDGVQAEAVSWIRDAAKRVTGGSCTFVDDDLKFLEALAIRAIDAGLMEGIEVPASTQANIDRAKAERAEAAPSDEVLR